MQKLFIYPKDIMILTGKSERAARRLITEIKKVLKKEKHQMVTYDELCQYLGIEIEKLNPLK